MRKCRLKNMKGYGKAIKAHDQKEAREKAMYDHIMQSRDDMHIL
ncbi:MAG: hypothetical protein ACLU80_06095 [Dorea sp.]